MLKKNFFKTFKTKSQFRVLKALEMSILKAKLPPKDFLWSKLMASDAKHMQSLILLLCTNPFYSFEIMEGKICANMYVDLCACRYRKLQLILWSHVDHGGFNDDSYIRWNHVAWSITWSCWSLVIFFQLTLMMMFIMKLSQASSGIISKVPVEC